MKANFYDWLKFFLLGKNAGPVGFSAASSQGQLMAKNFPLYR